MAGLKLLLGYTARMADGDGGGGLFSLGRKARGIGVGNRTTLTGALLGRTLTGTEIGRGVQIPEPVNPTLDPYSPYAAAWKEFDKLQKTAKNRGLVTLTHSWLGGIPGMLSLFDPHKSARPYERGLFVAMVVLIVIGFVRSRWAASRLAALAVPAMPQRVARQEN